MNDLTSGLLSRLADMSDNELLRIINDRPEMYRDEVLQMARTLARRRGLIIDLEDKEFKVITAGGHEQGPLDVLVIKDLYLKKSISRESLVHVASRNQWLPLNEVFNVDRWTTRTVE